MKKLNTTIALLALVTLISCKKDYTCECTTQSTTIYDDGRGNITLTTNDNSVTSVQYKDVKKSNLPVNCKDYSTINTSSNVSGTVTTTYKSEAKTTCTIK